MRAFDNCCLVYRGQRISNVSLLRSNAAFFSELELSDGNSRGLVLHLGSKAVFLIMTLLSAYSCLLHDNRSNKDVIKELNIGDLVIYGNSRGVFDGIDKQGRAVIKQAKSITCYVPQTAFYKIKPYHGNATTLDGRGVRKDFFDRQVFISHVFKMKPSDIPSVINCSVVIVCNKHEADLIIDDTEIEYDNGKRIPLRYIFTAAYYTPSDVYNYAGNSAKTDPVLKFTSKISVARELIIEDKEKKIVALLVDGRDAMDAGISELINLLSRRSLKRVILLSRIDDGEYKLLLDQFPELKLFAWTKDALLLHKMQTSETTASTSNELKKLSRYINNIISKEITFLKQDLDIDLDFYSIIKKSLLKIASNDYSNNEKDFFVINGFSLLNLFTSAFFPMKYLEEQVEMRTIGITSPAARLEKLKTIADTFSGLLGNEMKLVVVGLSEFYELIYYKNPKYDCVLEKLTGNYGRKKIALVVPKAFYFTIFSGALSVGNRNFLSDYEVVTANKFDNEKIYDEVFVTGIFEGKHFGIFSSNVSLSINVIAYPFEERSFNVLKRNNDKLVCLYNERNYVEYEWDSNFGDEDSGDGNEDTLFDIDLKLEEYINNVSISNAILTIQGSGVEGQTTAEIVRIATFESGETVFFTKNYCPYVFDAVAGTVIDSEVKKLVPGDVLVFTNHTDETRDIVEEILNNFVKSNRCNDKLKESYRKSKHWKNTLKQYMRDNDLSYRELSNEMHKFGHGKHEVTLRTWLDEDSHIVGPRDSESFYEIALITNDSEMLKNPEGFYEACRDIRSMRMQILRFIGINIINSIGSSLHQTDELLQSIAGDVGKLAVTLQIEKIVDTKELFVPAYMANRPQKS